MLTGRAHTSLPNHPCMVAIFLYGHCLPSFVSACRNLKIGYFSQHHVEQLDLNVSAVELLARKFPGATGI